MRIENAGLTALDLGATGNSEVFYVGNAALLTIQLKYAGASPTGTFKLMASCDEGHPSAGTRANQSVGVTNFTDLVGETKAITTDGIHLFHLLNFGYHWVRISYTRGSGTGSCAIRINSKG